MQGLYNKYTVINNETGREVEDWCFVLKPSKDPAAKVALKTYANATENESLRNDLYVVLKEMEE